MRQKFYDLDFIQEVLKLHHWECVFELDAPKKIVDRLSIRSMNEWLKGISHDDEMFKEFKNCFIQSEIYCPHEGIDRRKETGVLK